MRQKLSDVIQQNFPNVKNIKMKKDDMVNFLMHYCVVTFDTSEKELRQTETDKRTPVKQAETDQHGSRVSPVRKETVEERDKKKEVERMRRSSESSDDYDSDNGQAATDDDEIEILSDDTSQNNVKKLSTKATNDDESDLPKDALSICRRKLSKVLPVKNDTSQSWKEYDDSFKTLRTVIFCLIYKVFRCTYNYYNNLAVGGRWVNGASLVYLLSFYIHFHF